MRRDEARAALLQSLAIRAALPATYSELSIAIGLPVATVKYRVRIMRVSGLLHIGKWKRTEGTGGKNQPILHVGPGVDAKNTLRKLTDKDYSRKYRKVHAHDGVMDRKRAQERNRHWIKKAATRGDPLVNALFGTRTTKTRTPTGDKA